MDIVNAAFQITGAFLVWQNYRRLRLDRVVTGVDWRVQMFFTVWGYWNLLYYPHLGHWWSAVAGGFLAIGNTAWIVLYLHLRRGKRVHNQWT